MVKVDDITKDWREAGSFPAQINLYGFWDEHCFLTKSGDLGAVLRIGGIDYESLDHAGRDYAVKRLEAALRSLDDRCGCIRFFSSATGPPFRTPSMRTRWCAPLSSSARVPAVQSRPALQDRNLLDRHGGWQLSEDRIAARVGAIAEAAALLAPRAPRSFLRQQGAHASSMSRSSATTCAFNRR